MDNLAYQDEIRYELLNGTAVAMSPRPNVNHNIVSGNLFRIFGNFLKDKKCNAFSDGVDVHIDDANVVIPDAMIVCNQDIIKSDGIYGAPDLVVEVLSPTTAKNDKGYKKDLYEKAGVKEYWIVSINERLIEVYLSKDGKFVLDNVYSVIPDFMMKKMTEEEKEAVVTVFKTSLYEDLLIDIHDIFDKVMKQP